MTTINACFRTRRTEKIDLHLPTSFIRLSLIAVKDLGPIARDLPPRRIRWRTRWPRRADEAIAFAAEGWLKAETTRPPLTAINTIFADLKAGLVEGRMVPDLS